MIHTEYVKHRASGREIIVFYDDSKRVLDPSAVKAIIFSPYDDPYEILWRPNNAKSMKEWEKVDPSRVQAMSIIAIEKLFECGIDFIW